MKYDGNNMLVSIIPPESTQTVRSSICCVVDISGSMGVEATIQNENGEKETFGLSVLDVTKHALKTIVKSLTPRDEFSLVTFCSTVEVELEPRLMTEGAVRDTMEKIDQLTEKDMTNLWGGLKKGLDLLTESKPKTDNVALFLLTDGLPNIGLVKLIFFYKPFNSIADIGTPIVPFKTETVQFHVQKGVPLLAMTDFLYHYKKQAQLN